MSLSKRAWLIGLTEQINIEENIEDLLFSYFLKKRLPSDDTEQPHDKNENEQNKTGSNENEMSKHEIDYNQKHIREFIDLLQNCFADPRKGIKQEIYEQIWKLIVKDDLATVYLTLLTGKLLLLENEIQTQNENVDAEPKDSIHLSLDEVIKELKIGTYKYNSKHPLLLRRKISLKKRSKTGGSISEEISSAEDDPLSSSDQIFLKNALIKSLIYVSLFYRFDYQDASLLHLVEEWRNTKQSSITHELTQSLIPPKEALFKYLHFCTHYSAMDENDIVMAPPKSVYDPLTVTAAYVYSRLQTVCRLPKFTDHVIEDLIELITSPQCKLKNVLNFLKIIIPQLHFSSYESLKKLMHHITPYFIHPNPIGGLVRDILQLCKREILCPGAAMRERFEYAIQQVKTPNGIEDRRRTVYILLNNHATNASFINRFDLSSDMPPEEIDNVKANLLLNVYEAIGEDSEDLNNTPLEVLSSYYRKVSNVMKEVEKIGEGGLEAKKQELLDLKQEIIEAGKQSTSEKLRVRMKSPKMPEVEFELIQLPKEVDLQNAPKEKKIYPRSVYITTLLPIMMKAKEETPEGQECIVDIAIAGGSGSLQHFAHSYTTLDKLKKLDCKLRVYLIPLGVENYLSSWLDRYDGWYANHLHYPVLSAVPIFPHLKNKTAMFADTSTEEVSKKSKRETMNLRPRDPKDILSTVNRSGRQIPVKLNNYKSPRGYLTPVRYMRTLLSDYIIDARYPYPVNIYDVNCLINEVVEVSNSTGGNTPQLSTRIKQFISLSFCQRAEIGITAEAFDYQRKNKLEGMSVQDVINQKGFKYPNIQLKVSYVPMDTNEKSNSSLEVHEPPRTYNHIVIKSCSKYGDRGALVAPAQKWLEVNFEDAAQRKKKPKARDHELGVNCHVASITIESTSSDMFHVILDGELYGPFHKLIINKTVLSFQTQTFIDLTAR